ncbi:hypothetical protein EMPS_04057 [Entomortierella parvispora]|uniref:Uncharacterized protein n=1 Tax=Entomortierella parvispora TaxID=205924 RepID=A0A9P3H0Q0_9FUNG|nr:hypothetical protein EMPS_00374 [Entomortierella parvispora]GJJ71700.1 hypothetical protein EMPS_04057 [Entomortierella parvispora]
MRPTMDGPLSPRLPPSQPVAADTVLSAHAAVADSDDGGESDDSTKSVALFRRSSSVPRSPPPEVGTSTSPSHSILPLSLTSSSSTPLSQSVSETVSSTFVAEDNMVPVENDDLTFPSSQMVRDWGESTTAAARRAPTVIDDVESSSQQTLEDVSLQALRDLGQRVGTAFHRSAEEHGVEGRDHWTNEHAALAFQYSAQLAFTTQLIARGRQKRNVRFSPYTKAT